MASFRLHMAERFAAASANPKDWRKLARPARSHGDYNGLLLTGAAGLLIGAAAMVALHLVW